MRTAHLDESVPLLAQLRPLQFRSFFNTLLKQLSGGLNSATQPVAGLLCSYILKEQGYAAASELISAYQGMFRNVFVGVMGACGTELGKSLGKTDANEALNEANEIIAASHAMTAFLALLSSVAFAATPLVFPPLVDKKTAEISSAYFLISIVGNFQTMGINEYSQIIFVKGNSTVPLVAQLGFRGLVVGLSYFLVNHFHWKNGVGIANGVAPWIPYLFLLAWFHKTEYKELRQLPYSGYWLAIKKHFRLVKIGSHMGLQKFSEFGNMFGISIVLGHEKDIFLAIINPSLQLSNILGMFIQGVGMSANMMMMSYKKSLDESLIKMDHILDELEQNSPPLNSDAEIQHLNSLQKSLDEIDKLQYQIKMITKQSLGIGIFINGVVLGSLYWTAKSLVNLFMPSDASPQSHHLSEMTLWMMAIGLFADSPRIICGNILNTWGRILFPNIVSLISMTLIGIPLGYVLGLRQKENEPVYMFAVRAATIFIAATINMVILYRCVKKDDESIKKVQNRYELLVSLQNGPTHTAINVNVEDYGPFHTPLSTPR